MPSTASARGSRWRRTSTQPFSLWCDRAIEENDGVPSKSTLREIPLLEEAVGCSVQLINPFDLVEVVEESELPELLHCSSRQSLGLMLAMRPPGATHRLFESSETRNQKQLVPIETLLVGIPVVTCLLLAFVVYQKIASLICKLRNSLRRTHMQDDVKRADASLPRQRRLTISFLDGDANWLQEIRRMATEMPVSEQMIDALRVSASVNARAGGGVLKIEGGASCRH